MVDPNSTAVPWQAMDALGVWVGDWHVEARDDRGCTPLLAVLRSQTFWRSSSHPTAVVQILIKQGAAVHVWDKDGGCPWAYAQLLPGNRQEDVLRLLSDAGVVPSQANPETGTTALHWLVVHATDRVPALIHHFPTAHLLNHLGNPPLHVLMNHMPSMQINPMENDPYGKVQRAWEALLRHGAQPDHVNHAGETAHDLVELSQTVWDSTCWINRWQVTFAAWQQAQLVSTLDCSSTVRPRASRI